MCITALLCLGRTLLLDSLIVHAHDTPDAVTGVHVCECLVDLVEWLSVSDELVDLESALEVVVDKTGELRATLNTAESATLPASAGDELEG